MQVVHLSSQTRSLLTTEINQPGGAAAVCDLDGNPLTRDEIVSKAREVYLDTLTGNHFMRVSHAESLALAKDNKPAYQGQGGVHGWFVPAPDYTAKGRLGSKKKVASVN